MGSSGVFTLGGSVLLSVLSLLIYDIHVLSRNRVVPDHHIWARSFSCNSVATNYLVALMTTVHSI